MKPVSEAIKNDHWEDVMSDEWYKSIFVIQDVAVYSAHCFFHNKGLKHLLAPVTTGSISSPMGAGSDSLPVKVLLNGKEIYLADSMQFALEYGCRLSESGCYYIMQCFRGEEPDESHLSQFCHVEFEIRDTLEKTMNLAWEMVRCITDRLLCEAENEVKLLAGTTDHLKRIIEMSEPPVVCFDDAIHALDITNNEYVILENGARSLTKKGEHKLCKIFGINDVVWIKDMDKLSVPFYQADCDDEKHSITADLLIGGRETIGSGQRHVSSVDLLKSLKERSVNIQEYNWYIRMKNIKPLLTSGMGMGLERYLMWVTNTTDIRNIPIISRLTKEIITP